MVVKEVFSRNKPGLCFPVYGTKVILRLYSREDVETAVLSTYSTVNCLY